MRYLILLLLSGVMSAGWVSSLAADDLLFSYELSTDGNDFGNGWDNEWDEHKRYELIAANSNGGQISAMGFGLQQSEIVQQGIKFEYTAYLFNVYYGLQLYRDRALFVGAGSFGGIGFGTGEMRLGNRKEDDDSRVIEYGGFAIARADFGGLVLGGRVQYRFAEAEFDVPSRVDIDEEGWAYSIFGGFSF